jgi:23S rRNA-/tRNA-specific pseudouridylate synthase
MRAAGAPILFDPLYGLAIPRAAFTDAPCQRMALHARRLVVPHPTGLRSGASAGGRDVLWFEAPLAPDLVALGRWLNAHWNVDPTPT